MGYPHDRVPPAGVPPARSDGEYLRWGPPWQGYPLARSNGWGGPKVGYPLARSDGGYLRCVTPGRGTPQPGLAGGTQGEAPPPAGISPIWTWPGYSLTLGVDRHVSKYNLPVVLRTRSVNISDIKSILMQLQCNL